MENICFSLRIKQKNILFLAINSKDKESKENKQNKKLSRQRITCINIFQLEKLRVIILHPIHVGLFIY